MDSGRDLRVRPGGQKQTVELTKKIGAPLRGAPSGY